MKIEELRKLSSTELIEKCNQSVSELRKITVALKSGALSPENINKSRSLKRDIARIKTILNELKLLAKQDEK